MKKQKAPLHLSPKGREQTNNNLLYPFSLPLGGLGWALLSTLSLQAQIILNTNDLPIAGDVQISVKVDSIQALTLSPGNAGANILWDFSTLQPCCSSMQNSYDTLTLGIHHKFCKQALLQ